MPTFEQAFRYGDLRSWISEADRLGELRVVRGASTERDIGLASELVSRKDNGPAIVFDDIPGHQPGFRVLVNVFGGKRRNMTLGFSDDLSKTELSDACFQTFVGNSTSIPHVEVADGPVFENILTGDDIDVRRFPAPTWHEHDGGPYIGTGCYSVTRDIDTGWINAGTYRAQVQDEKSISILMVEGKHGQVQREKYFAAGRPMPIALVVGGDPLTFFMAGTEAPFGVCEFDLAGGIRGQAVETVRGRVTGLPFPANAELVFEGHIHAHDRRPEGPFGEWTGYYAIDEPEGVHTMTVEAVYHRNDPIMLGVPPIGGGADEMARYRAVLRSAMVRQSLKGAGVPGVSGVWCHEIGGSRMLHVVAISQQYAGHAMQAGHVTALCGPAVYTNRFVIVVDDDIDPTDIEQVLWAMCTRCDPETAISILRNGRTSPADPLLSPEKRRIGDITNSRAVIDACRPYHWRKSYPRMNALSPEMMREAESRFGHLLAAAGSTLGTRP